MTSSSFACTLRGRTPPGVRELKHEEIFLSISSPRRTPPGVRELKRFVNLYGLGRVLVAPLPGCVN